MSHLNRSTYRRLQKLPQTSSVWEGDRRTITAGLSLEAEAGTSMSGSEPNKGDCILWVDGSEGVVRSMDMVPPETGPEAIVRALLRAMEHPHGTTRPSRPQKIVVCDREIQFYLRGVLQDLDIAIDYVPTLPLIDQLFREFQNEIDTKPPQIPPEYASELLNKSQKIWEDAPWDTLGEYQILAIEINQWDIETLYVSIMGMLGEEYGILFYRSLESLKQFRVSVLQQESAQRLEEAFLKQDCLFITYEATADPDVDDEDEDFDLGDLHWSEIEPNFGILHPLEGLRTLLYDEEALAMWVALESLHRFMSAFRKQLSVTEQFPALNRRYRIPLPSTPEAGEQTLGVKVSTMPEVATELLNMVEAIAPDLDDDEDFTDLDIPLLRDDLVPDGALCSIGALPWDTVEQLRQTDKVCQRAEIEVPSAGDGLPVIIVQTSKPKALELIKEIQATGGVEGVGFNPGEDPFTRFDLGIFQTNDGDLHLFGEYELNPTHANTRKKWDSRCEQTKGYCGLIIAMGITGASRGNPQLKDMLAFFETKALSAKDLGLGTLQKMPIVF